jgi:hypothetical protein
LEREAGNRFAIKPARFDRFYLFCERWHGLSVQAQQDQEAANLSAEIDAAIEAARRKAEANAAKLRARVGKKAAVCSLLLLAARSGVPW